MCRPSPARVTPAMCECSERGGWSTEEAEADPDHRTVEKCGRAIVAGVHHGPQDPQGDHRLARRRAPDPVDHLQHLLLHLERVGRHHLDTRGRHRGGRRDPRRGHRVRRPGGLEPVARDRRPSPVRRRIVHLSGWPGRRSARSGCRRPTRRTRRRPVGAPSCRITKEPSASTGTSRYSSGLSCSSASGPVTVARSCSCSVLGRTPRCPPRRASSCPR